MLTEEAFFFFLVGKLTSKGKHTVKVGNHPHTNMISKLATVR